MKLIAEMETLLQDFREAQEQLIEELKVTQPDYAISMIKKLERLNTHYKTIIKTHKES